MNLNFIREAEQSILGTHSAGLLKALDRLEGLTLKRMASEMNKKVVWHKMRIRIRRQVKLSYGRIAKRVKQVISSNVYDTDANKIISTNLLAIISRNKCARRLLLKYHTGLSRRGPKTSGIYNKNSRQKSNNLSL